MEAFSQCWDMQKKGFCPRAQEGKSCRWCDGRGPGPSLSGAMKRKWNGEMEFDPEIQAMLEQWVEAKRIKDFETSDSIRSQLRAQGVDPDSVRSPSGPGPAMQQMGMPVGMAGMGGMPAQKQMRMGMGTGYDPNTQALLDQWVAAKRIKDFETSDRIRSELRSNGVDPDSVLPDQYKMGAPAAAQPVRLAAVPLGMQRQMQMGSMGNGGMGGGMGGMGMGMGGKGMGMAQQSWQPQQSWQVQQSWQSGGGKGSWSSSTGGQQGFDAQTQAELKEWIFAKRSKDFETADAIRSKLRARGIDPDTVKPDQAKTASEEMLEFGNSVEEVLDKWVEAKQNRDFARSDRIRSLLRAQGVDPDTVRPF